MTNSLMTPDTAPRDVNALSGQGPFIHRRLGEALQQLGFPCWASDREKQAFVTATPTDRAQSIVAALQAYDAARGAGGAPPPAQQQQQAASPSPAAPQGAATPPPATTGRQPKTNGAAAGGAGVGNVVELLNALKGIDTKIDSAIVTLGLAAAGSELEGLKAMVAASMQIQKVEIGLLCLIGENVLGAATADFIGEAVNYGASALEDLSPGKG